MKEQELRQLLRCKTFLEKNGWHNDEPKEQNGEYDCYGKKNLVSISINSEEIVFIGGDGDFLTLPVNYYCLIGALLEHRQIAADYVST